MLSPKRLLYLYSCCRAPVSRTVVQTLGALRRDGVDRRRGEAGPGGCQVRGDGARLMCLRVCVYVLCVNIVCVRIDQAVVPSGRPRRYVARVGGRLFE